MQDIIVYDELSNNFNNTYAIIKEQSKNLTKVNTDITNLISIVNNEYDSLESYTTFVSSDFPYLPLNTNAINIEQIIKNQINFTYSFKSKVNGSCKIYVLVNGYSTNRKDSSPITDSFEIWKNKTEQIFTTNFVTVNNRINSVGYYLLSSDTIKVFTTDTFEVKLNFNNSNGYKKYVTISNNGVYVGAFSSFTSNILL